MSRNHRIGPGSIVNATGNNNLGLGYNAGFRLTSGDDSLFIGNNIGIANEITGNVNIGIGNEVMFELSSGSGNLVIGGPDPDGFVGPTGTVLTTGDNNVILGVAAGSGATGSANVIIGGRTLTSSTGDRITGDNNTAIAGAMENTIVSGNHNISIGETSGSITSGSDNISFGRESGQFRTGSNNIALGVESHTGSSLNGTGNISIGTNSMSSLSFGASPSNNVCVGVSTGGSLITGTDNLLLGTSAGLSISTGNENVLLGKSAAFGMNSGSNNICIGREAGRSISSGSGNVFIGDGSDLASNVSDRFLVMVKSVFTPENALLDGEFNNRNLSLITGSITPSYGNGSGVIFIPNATTAPTTNPTNGGILYSDSGSITWRDPSGTVTDLTAGGGSSLQAAYTASTDPEITVDSTRGALTIQDNAVSISSNLFEVQSNGGGSTYFSVHPTLGVSTDALTFTNTSSTSSSLSFYAYDSQTYTFTMNDSGNTDTGVLICVRIGELITINNNSLVAITANASDQTIDVSPAIPVDFRHSAATSPIYLILVNNGGTSETLRTAVNSGGDLNLAIPDLPPFTSGTVVINRGVVSSYTNM